MYFAQVHSHFTPVPLLPYPEFHYPSPDSCTLLLSIFFFSLLSCHCHTLQSPLGIAACVYMDAVVPAGARIAPGGPHPSRKWGFLPAAINCQQFLNEDGVCWPPASTMLGLCLSWESCACSYSYCQFICVIAHCMQKTRLHYSHPLPLALRISLPPPL